MLGGIFHFFLGTIIGRIRSWMPPLVTGLVILTIGLSLIPVGIDYAAGGVPLKGKEAFGSFGHWGLALVVIVVTLGVQFYSRGFLSTASVLIGIIAGYIVAMMLGQVDFGRVASASWLALPQPFRMGFSLNVAAIVGMCLMAFVSAIETVGDISGITKGGANREATDKEISGGTLADGLGSAVAETCLENDERPTLFRRIGLNDTFSSVVGSQQHLSKKYKMDSNSIFSNVEMMLER